VRKVARIDHNGGGIAHGDTMLVGDFVLFAVNHLNNEWNSLLNRPYQMVSSHGSICQVFQFDSTKLVGDVFARDSSLFLALRRVLLRPLREIFTCLFFPDFLSSKL